MQSLKLDQLSEAIKALATERNLSEETIFSAVESAFATAWRRDCGERGQNVSADFNINSGDLEIFVNYDIVETVEDPLTQITLADAKKQDKAAPLEGIFKVKQDVPDDFGRIAAQAAKQAIIQSLKQSESEIMVEEYKDRVGTVIAGSIQRIESRFIKVDLGRASAVMPREEQSQGERYSIGERLKFYIKGIDDEGRIPTMIVSRSDPQLVVQLFKQEVPEIDEGIVEIRGIARAAGLRTKVAVFSETPGVDPSGTLIGGHGVRVKAVNSEVGELERIDIVQWSDDPVEFIERAMSPAKVQKVELNEPDKRANVYVTEEDIRVAIGRGGANVRLAGELTGYEIDVEKLEGPEITLAEDDTKPAKSKNPEDSLIEALDETPVAESDTETPVETEVSTEVDTEA
jgi:N utilization substance protein A